MGRAHFVRIHFEKINSVLIGPYIRDELTILERSVRYNVDVRQRCCYVLLRLCGDRSLS